MDTNFLDKSRIVMQKTLDSSRKLARAAPHRAWPGSRFISCLMPSWMSRVQRYPSGINFEQLISLQNSPLNGKNETYAPFILNKF